VKTFGDFASVAAARTWPVCVLYTGDLWQSVHKFADSLKFSGFFSYLAFVFLSGSAYLASCTVFLCIFTVLHDLAHEAVYWSNTGGKKMEDPHSLKSNEMAQCSFQPQQPLVCDTFKNCEGLSRVAFMDGNGVVMLGKVISCERKEEGDKGGKKK